MRRESKYKVFSKIGGLLKKFPLRILKFHRPKWNFIKNKIRQALRQNKSSRFFLKKNVRKKNSKNRFFFKVRRKKKILINNFSVRSPIKKWVRNKEYYKLRNKNKILLKNVFDNSIKFNLLKKASKNLFFRRDIFLNYFVVPVYKLDILLWILNLCVSSFEARQLIYNNNVLINGKRVCSNVVVKKGDIISFELFTKENFLYKDVIKKFTKSKTFLSFIELDYYTKTAVIIKDFQELSNIDICLISNLYLDLKYFSR